MRRRSDSRRALDDFERMYRGLGVSRRYARRALQELQDHYDDLLDEAVAAGLNEADAAEDARARLGNASLIAEATMTHENLITCQEHPLANGGGVLRWGVSACLGATITAGMLLFMHAAIVVTP